MFRAAARMAGLLLCLYGACAPADELVWQSGFENGFPGGEWLNWDNGSFSPDGTMPGDHVSAWTIVDRRSDKPVFAGNHAYKGWIVGPSGESHRPYPVIHADILTPLVNTFMVYLDTDYGRMSRTDSIHLGTWGNHDATAKTGLWALHTMAVRERKLEFAHTVPFHGEYIGPMPRRDFPLRRWVRLTVYIIYRGAWGFVQVWQDGVPMLRAQVAKLESNPGTRLRTAHWGMYAPRNMDQGAQYNDEIRICTLNVPLTELVSESRCPPASTALPLDAAAPSPSPPSVR